MTEPEALRNKGGRPPGPSRETLSAELTETKAQNEALAERLAKLEAAFAAKPAQPDPEMARRLREAEAELEALRPGASRATAPLRGVPPKFVPYKGTVRARTDCVIGSYQYGPDNKMGQPVSIFEVDVPVLWSDDPYEPVTVTVHEDGAKTAVPRTDVAVVNARWRTIVDPDARNPIARAV
jgi:hypothetical protein